MTPWWEIALVVLIEVAAVAFLASRFWPRKRRWRRPPPNEPDVKLSALVRKKKPGCH